jgi:hypothetical protein
MSLARNITAGCLVVLAALLMTGGNNSASSSPPPASAPDTQPAATQSRPPATQAQARVPIAYFEFASDSRITPARVRELAEKYQKNVMIGADSGNSDSKATMAAAKAAGVFRHIYLEGPCGVTGNQGIAPDELARMKAGAKYAGIDISKPDWRKKWNDSGWKVYTRHQIKDLYADYDSYEIDNLYNGIGDTGASLVAFLKEQQAWAKENGIKATIMLKNIESGQWPLIVKAVKSGELSRAGLTDFCISEEDFKASEKQKQAAAAASIGIQQLDSPSTYNYAARGEYRVGR